METKKVTLNKTRCQNLHIGKKKQCPDLKVHGEKMNKADQIKYIGDEIDKTGKAKATIEKRKAKGFDLPSEITAITDDIPLGPWRLQSGLMLRQAMLVNGTLFNSECWQGKDVDKDIKILNKPDEALHRSLVSAH